MLPWFNFLGLLGLLSILEDRLPAFRWFAFFYLAFLCRARWT